MRVDGSEGRRGLGGTRQSKLRFRGGMGRNTSEEVVTVDMGCNTSDNVRLCDNITTLALHGLAIYNMCMCNSIFRIVLFAWIAAALMPLLQLFVSFSFVSAHVPSSSSSSSSSNVMRRLLGKQTQPTRQDSSCKFQFTDARWYAHLKTSCCQRRQRSTGASGPSLRRSGLGP